jgi:hypothetical protein
MLVSGSISASYIYIGDSSQMHNQFAVGGITDASAGAVWANKLTCSVGHHVEPDPGDFSISV